MLELWICLIILHVWQTYEDVSGSKCVRVLNIAKLYMQRLHRVLNMSEYASVCLSNAWIWLSILRCPSICPNMTEYCWVSVNMPQNNSVKTVLTMPGLSVCLIIRDIWQGFEYTSYIKYARVLNMLQYSYNNFIIIVTVILLEYFSARFVHPGTLQLTHISFF